MIAKLKSCALIAIVLLPVFYSVAGADVDLIYLTAISGRDRYVPLEWKTASERNNVGFHIERSMDEVNFERITQEVIPGAGNSITEFTYNYIDSAAVVNGTTYYYNLISVDYELLEELANDSPAVATPGGTPVLVTPSAHMPKAFDLGQNYPNPFNANTKIKYQIPKDSHVTLKIFNVMGQEIIILMDDQLAADSYTTTWNGRDAKGSEVTAGIYFCTMRAGEFRQTRKMVLLR